MSYEGLSLRARLDQATRRKVAAERVAVGARALDAKDPDWWKQIDIGELDLASPEKCVLGQLFAEPQTVEQWEFFGYDSPEAMVRFYKESSPRSNPQPHAKLCTANFEAGKSILHLDDQQASMCGFNVTEDSEEVQSEPTYGDLDWAWEREVERREIEAADGSFVDA
jgi:hypothetical protein